MRWLNRGLLIATTVPSTSRGFLLPYAVTSDNGAGPSTP
jgi:hypothetical protein